MCWGWCGLFVAEIFGWAGYGLGGYLRRWVGVCVCNMCTYMFMYILKNLQYTALHRAALQHSSLLLIAGNKERDELT